MNKKKLTNVEENKFIINPIDNTPFVHMQVGEKNFLVCGKIKLELNDNIDLQKATQWLKENPWDAICLLVEAIINKTNDNKQ